MLSLELHPTIHEFIRLMMLGFVPHPNVLRFL
jgi:hypothetical protein